MPQITYIDTGSSHRDPTSRQRDTFRAKRFWRSVARRLVAHRLAVLAVLALYRFVGLGTGEMQQWDEAIYALRAQTILSFGTLWDQSAFMLSGTYYSAHPPLYVWLSTAFLLLFGDDLWVYRLTSAMAAALLVPLVYRLSRMLQSRLRSVVTAGLFAVLSLPAIYSRLGQLDLLLTLGMTAALYFALRSLRDRRAADTLLAGISLGAALMTKLLFAFSVPAAVALSALLLADAQRRRALRVAVVMVLISIPLWLPWAWTFAATHGGGAGFLFSSSLPLGATFAGLEGSAKDTGALYYLNQLVVNLSALFPFAVYSIWHALRRAAGAGWTLTAATILLTLAALWVMRSSFEVYLIPILPLLLLHAVRGVDLLRRAERRTMLSYALAAALCLPWSLFHSWREAVKQLLRSFSGAAPSGTAVIETLLLAACVAVAIVAVWMLYRRNRLRALFSLPITGTALLVLAASTVVRLGFTVPSAPVDGAQRAAAAVRGSNATRIFLIGNGDNPQLTFYFHGADIGWSEKERLRFERLEPRALGVAGIRSRLAARMRKGPMAVLIERDEIAQGAYERARDLLPAGVTIRLRSGRYQVAGNAALVLPRNSSTGEGEISREK
jgi:4-amino-4-deoxy-L-arabinose transferase-like glycosyltransferase